MHKTLSDYIVDLTQNSVKADSNVIIVSLMEREDGYIKVYIADDGAGMDAETLARIRELLPEDRRNAPVCKCSQPLESSPGSPVPPVSGEKRLQRTGGQGIPYLAELVDKCGGVWDVVSEDGIGTSLFFEINAKHQNAPPLGNLASAVACCMGMEGGFDLNFSRALGDESYSVIRSKAAETLGDLHGAPALAALREFVRQSENELTKKGD
ncbi:MAG: ATP-binding protein [Chitinispirillales bacterium]|jgi:hypothetical protein|nr:ATP-binding protein [Chitinispirillales bacterium]